MFYLLSKFLPPLVYPLGLACVLILFALVRGRRARPHADVPTGIRRSTSEGWRTAALVTALALLWLGGNRLAAMSLMRSLEWRHLPSPALRDYRERAEVIVVLGGATRAFDYPRLSSEVNEAGDRLLYAAQLYRHGVAPRILLSGGSARVVGKHSATDAESMARVLVEIGIPEDALVLEDVSRNTYENAIEARRILTDRGIDRILLVTSAVHMPRAESVFRKAGFTVIPAPTDFQITQQDWAYFTRPNPLIQLNNLMPVAYHLELTSRALKEYIGLVVYGLRGWR